MFIGQKVRTIDNIPIGHSFSGIIYSIMDGEQYIDSFLKSRPDGRALFSPFDINFPGWEDKKVLAVLLDWPKEQFTKEEFATAYPEADYNNVPLSKLLVLPEDALIIDNQIINERFKHILKII